MTVLLLLALAVADVPAEAQNFGLSVSNSASSLLVSNFLTYTINLTNLNFSLADAFVTNGLPASAEFISASPEGFFTTDTNGVVFELGQFASGEVVQLTLTVEPTSVGFITNMVAVSSPDTTNIVSTNVVTQVTNTVTQADLAVALSGPAQTVITNDFITYEVTATNLGPTAAPDVMLTNTLPPGVIFQGVAPANRTYTLASSNLIFNLGTLTNNGFANLQFSVEPTNAGVLTFSASIGSADVLDANSTNNFASTNVVVTNYFPGIINVSMASTQYFNPQNGLVEQLILLSNAGTNGVAAARLVVSGLTNQLFNAVGTNSGNPFVYFSAPLAAGQSANLLLQYVANNYFAISNSQLNAFAVPLPNWTPPTATSTSTNVNISRIVQLANGDMLIEWPSITNRIYTVVYGNDASFSNAMIAPPSLKAPANRTQWIDYGPPATTSAPTNSSARFYRVFLNP